MLRKFNYSDKSFPYHEKIKNKILTTLKFLPDQFWNSNPIISGGYAIHLLFKPYSTYDDIDLYFRCAEDYNSAKSILTKIAKEKTSQNSDTFNIDSNKIQLINKFFKEPEDIIYAHDFKNSSICITRDEITLDDELFKLYYNSELSIRNTQIYEAMNDDDKIRKIGLLYNRIIKYQSRYDLTLDDESVKTLQSLYDFLKTFSDEKMRALVVNSSIYYNGNHSSCQNNLRNMTEIFNHMNTFLFPYNHQHQDAPSAVPF